ncbi:MAG: hypothetical protein ACRC1H_11575, partial [Caldilineaceae bacterium]
QLIRASALLLAVAAVAGCILALQVTFTRVFSLMIWHHFTYLVIGVALLGSGAAGTFLSVKGWSVETIQRRLWRVAAAFAGAIVLTLALIVLVRFDPLRGEELARTIFGLVLYFGVLFLTFFLGALVIVCAFRLRIVASHRLYFADLLGAASATLASVFVVRWIGGPSTLLLLALLAMLAAWLLRPTAESVSTSTHLLPAAMTGAITLLFVGSLIWPVQLPIPQSKSLYWAMQASGQSTPEYTRWNPVARVDVTAPVTIDSPMIVGGVSQRYLDARLSDAPSRPLELRFVTLDGTSMTGLYAFDGDLAPFEFLKHTIIAAPYLLAPEAPTYLAIGVGGGLDILLARQHGAGAVTAIDLNADVIHLLQGPYAEYTGRLADDPQTRLVASEGRNFLMRDRGQYDIIQGIGLDNVVALSSGAYVLAESYLYTVEAVQLALEQLTAEGVWSWTRNTSAPPSEMLRLAGIAAEALGRMGVSEPARHMMMVANEDVSTITLLVTRSPIGAEKAAELVAWADANGFPILHHPVQAMPTEFAEYLLAPDRRAFEPAYPLSIGPVYDDHPFYYNFYKFSNLSPNPEYAGTLSVRFPVGNIILLTMMACSFVAAFLFILLPLLRFRRKGLRLARSGPTLTYFSALGVAFIFVEIVLIQRFTLFIGPPTLSATTTIASLLLASGFGSLLAQRLCTSPQRLRLALGLLTMLVLLYALGLKPLLDQLLWVPDLGRVLIAMALIAPLGLLMGMPFPTGLARLSHEDAEIVPWAWGLNGVFSVLGSTLVIIVSMIWNFTAAFALGAVFYTVALFVAPALWSRQLMPTAHPLAPTVTPALAMQEQGHD